MNIDDWQDKANQKRKAKIEKRKAKAKAKITGIQDKHSTIQQTRQLQDERGKASDRQDKTRQDKTRQDKPRQDKTRQDKTRQDKTRQPQDKTAIRQNNHKGETITRGKRP
jgi:hypothetical protein